MLTAIKLPLLAAVASAAQIEWEYAITIERNSPLVDALATALELSPTDIDNLFIAADRL